MIRFLIRKYVKLPKTGNTFSFFIWLKFQMINHKVSGSTNVNTIEKLIKQTPLLSTPPCRRKSRLACTNFDTMCYLKTAGKVHLAFLEMTARVSYYSSKLNSLLPFALLLKTYPTGCDPVDIVLKPPVFPCESLSYNYYTLTESDTSRKRLTADEISLI